MSQKRAVGIAALLGVIAALVAGAGSAVASGALKHCKPRPDRLAWNIEARGVKCSVARGLAAGGVKGKVKTVAKHLWRYQTPSGWTCLYTEFHSTKAQDSEGEIFDCRMHGAIARWSDSPGIQPHSLR
jgi:hypothetical protein